MTQLKKEIAENGIHYTLHGDYYFPHLELPEAAGQAIGRYVRVGRKKPLRVGRKKPQIVE